MRALQYLMWNMKDMLSLTLRGSMFLWETHAPSHSLTQDRWAEGWKVLLPAVISLWESDRWVILFLGCQGTGCSHANPHRGAGPLWNKLKHLKVTGVEHSCWALVLEAEHRYTDAQYGLRSVVFFQIPPRWRTEIVISQTLKPQCSFR